MYRLYHHILCPFSRKVRVYLAAKEIDFNLVSENFWEKRKEFIVMNPAGTIPVLFDNLNGELICDSSVIIEYIEEKHNDGKNLIGNSLQTRAEARRIQKWFDEKFYNEVTKYILNERYFNRYLPTAQAPDSNILRIARNNLAIHLDYIEYLLENRKYLASDHISIADFAVAAQLSSIDYFGDISWQNHPIVKDWYSLVKSRKIFSEILKDKLINLKPPEWYIKIDF